MDSSLLDLHLDDLFVELMFVIRIAQHDVSYSFFAVKLNANRMVVGTLRGFDQFMNLVVDNTVEVNGNEKNDIGMVVS